MPRRPLLLLLAVAALALGMAPAAGACIKRHDVRIAKGTSPTGWGWELDGSIGDNGNRCRDWLFGVNFTLQGAIDWGSSTGVPVGGHLGPRPGVDANDSLLVDGSDRVFSGTVETAATKVVATLSDNQHLVIHPQLPPANLRRKVVWLRGFRYFVAYYAPEGFVTGVSTFDRSGRLLFREKHFEGF